MPENWHFEKRYEIRLSDQGSGPSPHDAKRYFDMMQNHEFLDVYGTLDINTWQDTRKVQLLVTEMAPTEDIRKTTERTEAMRDERIMVSSSWEW